MAKTTVTHITDDIDGTTGADEVAFSYEGIDYTIDLAKKNRAALEKALKPYLEVATRQARRNSSRGSARKTSGNKRDLAAVREWAKAQGIEVSERGRVAAGVIEQYDWAH